MGSRGFAGEGGGEGEPEPDGEESEGDAEADVGEGVGVLAVAEVCDGIVSEGGEGGEGTEEAGEDEEAEIFGKGGVGIGEAEEDAEEETACGVDGEGAQWEAAAGASDPDGEAVAAEGAKESADAYTENRFHQRVRDRSPRAAAGSIPSFRPHGVHHLVEPAAAAVGLDLCGFVLDEFDEAAGVLAGFFGDDEFGAAHIDAGDVREFSGVADAEDEFGGRKPRGVEFRLLDLVIGEFDGLHDVFALAEGAVADFPVEVDEVFIAAEFAIDIHAPQGIGGWDFEVDSNGIGVHQIG